MIGTRPRVQHSCHKVASTTTRDPANDQAQEGKRVSYVTRPFPFGTRQPSLAYPIIRCCFRQPPAKTHYDGNSTVYKSARQKTHEEGTRKASVLLTNPQPTDLHPLAFHICPAAEIFRGRIFHKVRVCLAPHVQAHVRQGIAVNPDEA